MKTAIAIATLMLTGCSSSPTAVQRIELDMRVEMARAECYKAQAFIQAKKTALSGTEQALIAVSNALAGIDTSPCKITGRHDVEIAVAKERTKRWQTVSNAITSPIGIAIALRSRGGGDRSSETNTTTGSNNSAVSTESTTQETSGSYNTDDNSDNSSSEVSNVTETTTPAATPTPPLSLGG